MSQQFASQAAKYFVRPHTTTPTGPIDHPAAWYGSDMVNRADEWLIQFGADDIDAQPWQATLSCRDSTFTK